MIVEKQKKEREEEVKEEKKRDEVKTNAEKFNTQSTHILNSILAHLEKIDSQVGSISQRIDSIEIKQQEHATEIMKNKTIMKRQSTTLEDIKQDMHE